MIRQVIGPESSLALEGRHLESQNTAQLKTQPFLDYKTHSSLLFKSHYQDQNYLFAGLAKSVTYLPNL